MEELHKQDEVNSSDNTYARIFLRHFQVLQPWKINQLSFLKDDENFNRLLKKIDMTTLKLSLKVPFLYIKNIESTTFETNYSEDPYYNEFLISLGNILDEHNIHTGNFDHLIDLICNIGIVYSTNLLTELNFLTPTIKKYQSPSIKIYHSLVFRNSFIYLMNQMS